MNQERSGGMASKSFCPLPWNHLATHPDGQVSLCCEAETIDGVSNAHFTVSQTRVFNTLLATKYDFNKINIFINIFKGLLIIKQMYIFYDPPRRL